MQPFVTETVFERTGGVSLMARGVIKTGAYFTQAAITSINLKIFDKANQGAPINGDTGEAVTVSTTIFDSPRTTDPTSSATIWTTDGTGFNFLYRTSSAQLPEGNRTYIFEFQVNPAGGGDPLWGVFEVPTLNLLSKTE